MKTLRTFSLTILSLGLLVLLPSLGNALPIGEIAPDFILPNLHGEMVSLASHGDRPLLLVIGTTWCPSCRAQSREIQKVAEHFSAERLAVMDVFIQETESSVRSYVKDVGGHPESALIDDETVQDIYSIYLIPRVLIVDSNGRIVYDGSATRANLLIEKIASLLNVAEPGKSEECLERSPSCTESQATVSPLY